MVNPIEQAFRWADTQPEKLAIAGANAEIDYRTFKSSVKKIAAMLKSHGVKPGHVVGVRMHGALHGIFVSAIMHEGAVAFAVKGPVLDKYGEHIDFVFSDETLLVAKAAQGVLVDAEFLTQADRLNTNIEPFDLDSENDLVHLVFSSGTTGVPKGVCFTVAELQQRTVAAHDNWMKTKPFFCELALDTISGMLTFFQAIFTGDTYLVPSSAVEDANLIEKYKVSCIKTSPAKLKDLVAAFKEQGNDFSSLKEIQVAGGLLSSELGAEVVSLFGVSLTYLYGSTEVGAVTRGSFDPAMVQNVGSILPTAEVQILDEQGHPLPFESDGAIRIKTTYQSKSYWNLQGSGSSTFRDGWFYPGDRARRIEDGTLHILGRVDEVVNLAGMKVDPGWIDARISRYRGIKDFACFAVPDESLHYEKLAIAVVFDDEISIENFMTHLQKELGDSSPQAIVRVLEIPRNSLGKPNRLQLRQDYIQAMGSGTSV